MNASAPLHAVDPLPLATAVQYLLEECRIVLPGIQVLFGFQLIAVFSDRFATLALARRLTLRFLTPQDSTAGSISCSAASSTLRSCCCSRHICA